MATLPKARTVTYEKWLRMPVVQNGREEVVNGEIRILRSAILAEGVLKPKHFPALAAAFLTQLDLSTTEFFASEFGLVIRREPLTCRQPDLAVFERATMVEEDGYVHSAPQLTIEVLSPSETRKEIAEKLRDYESIGAEEVWLVSPEARTVEILCLAEGKLRRSAILAEGVLKPKHFPAVQIDISQIWSD